MAKLSLPDVTLCAAASVNVEATVHALNRCVDQVDFGRAVLFTDTVPEGLSSAVEHVRVPRIASAADYSAFLLRDLVDHVRTSHCLVVQWDGFILDAQSWDPEFLRFDYIGARWPQFLGDRDVGNGGFSLRSRRLLELCRADGFEPGHPEDVAICRTNRPFLESRGIVFAPPSVADRFAFERSAPAGRTFGFHGIFNMIAAIGAESFWAIYERLDDRRSAFVDYPRLVRQLGGGKQSWRRRAKFTLDAMAWRLTPDQRR